MSPKAKPIEKRKRVVLSINRKLQLIKKLEEGASVVSVCEEFGVKKQTVSDIRKSREKLEKFAMQFDVSSSKDRKGNVRARMTMKVAHNGDLENEVYKWYVKQKSANANVRGVEIMSAANKIARQLGLNHKASSGWLWRFRHRYGICKKAEHGEVEGADHAAVEIFRQQLNELIKNEDIHPSQLYNVDVTSLLWHSLPRNTQAFRHKQSTQGKSISEMKFSALLGANAAGTHRLKPVVVGKAAKPRYMTDCMTELPVVYYNTRDAWFNSAIFNDWFFKHFVPEVCSFQESVLRIPPDEVKALLLVVPAHPSEQKLVSSDGKIRTMFFPAGITSLIQPMDQGVIVSCKRHYQRKYLDEVMEILEEENDLEVDTRGQRTLENLKNYNLKSAIYNFALSWNLVKMETLADSWKKLLQDEDPDLNFEGFAPEDFRQVFQRGGENGVSVDDIEDWLEEKDAGDSGYQVLKTEKTAEPVVTGAEEKGESSSEEKELMVSRPKMSEVRQAIDTLINYIDHGQNSQLQGYCEQLRTIREIVIREQHNRDKHLKLDGFFQRRNTPEPAEPGVSPSPSPSPQPDSPAPVEPDFLGFESGIIFSPSPQPGTSIAT